MGQNEVPRRCRLGPDSSGCLRNFNCTSTGNEDRAYSRRTQLLARSLLATRERSVPSWTFERIVRSDHPVKLLTASFVIHNSAPTFSYITCATTRDKNDRIYSQNKQVVALNRHMIGFTGAIVVRSLHDHGATVTGCACAAGLAADRACQEGASGSRNDPKNGVLRGRNRGEDINAFSRAGGVGKGRSGVPQWRPPGSTS